MSDPKTVQDLNEELARKIHEEAQRNPQSPYANKCVAVLDGQDVVAADDWDELDRLLREIKADPEKCLYARIDPNAHFGAENEIWELH
jgi:hypothetical protein